MDYPGKVITKTQVTPTQTSASGNWTLDDQAAAIKNNNWPVALVPNPISKSLRFNSADSAYLNRTPASAGNRQIFTWSGWVKRSASGNVALFTARTDDSNRSSILFESENLRCFNFSGGSVTSNLVTSAVFRDFSAWYHVVISMNTTTQVGKIYVNGVEQTLGTNTVGLNSNFFFNNTNAHAIGRTEYSTPEGYFNGYMTEINFIDGQALTPSDFGLTNPQTGQWIPKKYTGTYGTNGFYLNFKDATSTTTLGYDYSGNANNWTTNNFSVTAGVGNDSLTDVPTPWVAYNTTGDVGGVIRGNYCTLNPLDVISAASARTLTNGNLDCSLSNTWNGGATLAVTSGSWYCEATLTSNFDFYIGIDNGFGIVQTAYRKDGTRFNGSSFVSYGASYTTNDVVGMAFDVTNSTVTYYKNGVSQGQVTGVSYSSIARPFFYGVNGTTFVTNFGQRPFAYTPPAGFRSLCTTNLPATTIGFGLTNQGNNYFDATLYTGTGSGSGTVTNAGGFKPDLVWAKGRNTASQNNILVDSVRGANIALESNLTDAELAISTIASFTSTGFTTSGTVNNGYSQNVSGQTYVGWQWRAAGSTVTNTAGTITSTVSANTTAGFAIATTTGAGGTGTIGHGLGAVPQFIMCFRRNTAADHYCYHQAIGNTNYLVLNTTAASAASANMWNNTTPTSTVFSVGNTNNNSGDTYVHYIFAPVAGYSAFGSYTGNGSADGPFVYTGFRPAFVLIKNTNTAGNEWFIYDAARNTFNVMDKYLLPNSSGAEGTFTTLDFTSNGFKLRTGAAAALNANAGNYIYACFAESPFQFANAR